MESCNWGPQTGTWPGGLDWTPLLPLLVQQMIWNKSVRLSFITGEWNQ